MPAFRRLIIATTLALPLLGAGCAAREDSPSGDTIASEAAAAVDTGQAPAAPVRDAAPAADQPLVLTEADIEVFRRGKEAEIAHIARQAEEMRQAKSGLDSLKVMAALMEGVTDSVGASAAGVSIERYGAIEDAITDVLREWRMIGMQSTMLQQMKSSDTTGQAAEVKALTREAEQRMRSEIERLEKYEGIPAQNVQLVTRQAARLDSLLFRVARRP
jgi:hypothetical protein